IQLIQYFCINKNKYMSYIFPEDISKIFGFNFDENRINPNKSNTVINNDGLQLSPININAEYRAKWNVHETDFVVLTKNGEMVRPTLYR
ncbi:hypothetical protein M3M33_14470, partial [Loigolactobacillus coryniformis]|uniref:hypothetical protein n=1 Tax=Loigolactobacillus coryniformis TaxID=1610 RepID=UPI00201AED21